eukprot:TRINITY_DN784_c0_g2_i5.p1 TRINITY_DN784_c0_g2~~TRINITY_DN784_c0_g2_i5.p1  ORF type:complete len:169 (+),score=17.46 TRINITY_DN784_c0_g2_i5:91-597(+)
MSPPHEVETRNAAKAIITRGVGDDCELLLIKTKKGDREGYTLPGGGQDPGESMQEAVIRECMEEVGADVTVVRLLCVYERKSPPNSASAMWSHKVNFAFLCRLVDEAGYVPCYGSEPDLHQVGVVWVPVKDVPDIKMSQSSLTLPKLLPDLIRNASDEIADTYLGWLD